MSQFRSISGSIAGQESLKTSERCHKVELNGDSGRRAVSVPQMVEKGGRSNQQRDSDHKREGQNKAANSNVFRHHNECFDRFLVPKYPEDEVMRRSP